MKYLQSVTLFLKKPFFSDRRTLLGLWLLLPVVAALIKISKHNNFLIFRYVYWHTVEQLPLYIPYPDQYADTNHYGPFFSLVIAPFALLPTWWGLLFWEVALSLFLLCRQVPAFASPQARVPVLVLCARIAHGAFHVAIQYCHCGNHTDVILLH